MMPRLVHRLERLERAHAQDGGTADGTIQPGMMAVLMYGVAVYIGGFPGPEGVRGPYLADTVDEALARALGFDDAEQMRVLAERTGEWTARFASAVSRLLTHLGIEREANGSPAMFRGFVRMLDEIAAAEPTWGRARGWSRIGAELDAWIRAAGLSPEAIRSEARQ